MLLTLTILQQNTTPGLAFWSQFPQLLQTKRMKSAGHVKNAQANFVVTQFTSALRTLNIFELCVTGDEAVFDLPLKWNSRKVHLWIAIKGCNNPARPCCTWAHPFAVQFQTQALERQSSLTDPRQSQTSLRAPFCPALSSPLKSQGGWEGAQCLTARGLWYKPAKLWLLTDQGQPLPEGSLARRKRSLPTPVSCSGVWCCLKQTLNLDSNRSDRGWVKLAGERSELRKILSLRTW